MSYRTGYETDQDRNDPLVFFLHQVTDDLVVKVLNRLPLQGNIGRGRGEERGGKGEKGEEERVREREVEKEIGEEEGGRGEGRREEGRGKGKREEGRRKRM